MRRVILITGPPCAGKTTWARQHAKPGDTILDQDQIGPAAMRRGLEQAATMTDGTAWIIRCCPGPAARTELAARIRATDVVHLQPPPHVLLTRAQARTHAARHVRAVQKWLEADAASTGPAADPQPRPREAW